MRRRRGILILIEVIVVSLVIIGCVKSSQEQLKSIKNGVIASESLTGITSDDIWVYRYESNDYVYVYKNNEKTEYPINSEKIQEEIDKYIEKQNLKTIAIVIAVIVAIFFAIAV